MAGGSKQSVESNLFTLSTLHHSPHFGQVRVCFLSLRLKWITKTIITAKLTTAGGFADVQ